MEAILLQYGWVLIVLVVLEGLLAADNAVVMAVMVKHLPQEQQKKALFYCSCGKCFTITAITTRAAKKGVILWTIWSIDIPILRIICYYCFSELLANTSGRCSLSIIYVCEKYI